MKYCFFHKKSRHLKLEGSLTFGLDQTCPDHGEDMEDTLVQIAIVQRCMSIFYKICGAWPELVTGKIEKGFIFVLASFLDWTCRVLWYTSIRTWLYMGYIIFNGL